MFQSLHGLMNSINWPASSIWVFIAQLGEHCSANAEATGSNPVEAPKKLFFGLFSQLLKLRFTAMVTYSFHLYSRGSHHFIQYYILRRNSIPIYRVMINSFQPMIIRVVECVRQACELEFSFPALILSASVSFKAGFTWTWFYW